MTEAFPSDKSVPKREDPPRRDQRSRAEGGEQELDPRHRPDPRDLTNEYLRDLERTKHWRPIKETAGAQQ